MKLIAVAIAGLALGFTLPSTAQTPKTPEQIANLSVRGFAQFQCASLASAAKNNQTEPHFNAGYASLHEFLTLARGSKDTATQKAISDETPMIVLMALGGPNIEFEIGVVWSAVNQYVDDELNDRETWTHQKEDPKAANVDREVIQMRAEKQYRDHNCAILSK